MWILFAIGLGAAIVGVFLADRWWFARRTQRELMALLAEPVESMGWKRLCLLHARSLMVEQMLFDMGQEDRVRDVHLFMARCEARLGQLQQHSQSR